MSMLIGKQNQLNHTLEGVIRIFIPEATRVSPEEFLSLEDNIDISDPVVFVNITDLTDEEALILKKLDSAPARPKVIGMHTFMVPDMKNEVLKRGFDGYLSFFEFADHVEELLSSLGVPVSY